jgi:hypothetical protein
MFIRTFTIKYFPLCLFLLSSISFAGSVHERFPSVIKPTEKYVFYSHGRIVEGSNPTPIHPRWGTYDFPEVKKALTDDGYNLIAYHRPKNTDPKVYGIKLGNDVKTLIASGVKPENITLLGFSQGGAITIHASHYLKSKKVRVALLASCVGFMKNNADFSLFGHVYSIYETSDSVGSCQFLIDKSSKVEYFKEIAISTGKEHGAFYQPMAEWIKPLKVWLNKYAS